LEPLRGLVVLDEIQRVPDLFSVLRVLADRSGEPARFLVLGSASPDLLRQGSESLAGRIAYHQLGGLCADEVDPARTDDLWTSGGFPRSFLANTEAESARWRQEFVRTFTERLPGTAQRVLGADAFATTFLDLERLQGEAKSSSFRRARSNVATWSQPAARACSRIR